MCYETFKIRLKTCNKFILRFDREDIYTDYTIFLSFLQIPCHSYCTRYTPTETYNCTCPYSFPIFPSWNLLLFILFLSFLPVTYLPMLIPDIPLLRPTSFCSFLICPSFNLPLFVHSCYSPPETYIPLLAFDISLLNAYLSLLTSIFSVGLNLNTELVVQEYL